MLDTEIIGGLVGIAAGESAWQNWALCAETDPDAFFPDKGESNSAAKRVCQSCPVTFECLSYALAHAESYGIWGGTSALERRALRRDGLNH